MAKRKLTRKQQTFIDAYFICRFNGTAAARMAGYAGDDATLAQVAYENLRKPDIQSVIDARMAEYTMSANEVLARLTEHARGDIGEIFDEKTGGVLWSESRRVGKTSLIKKIKQTTITTDDSETHIFELELYSAQEALKTLGKFHKLWVDRVQNEDNWEALAIADIRAGAIPYEALAAEDETLAEKLFRMAGVPIPVSK